MGKIKDWLKKYGLVAAVATAPVAGQAADNHTQDDKGVKTEQTSLSQEDLLKYKVATVCAMLKISREDIKIGQVSEEDNIIKNVYTNDKGEKVNQYFTNAKMSYDGQGNYSESWLVMHEVSSSGKHSMRARNSSREHGIRMFTFDYDKLKGEYSETYNGNKLSSTVYKYKDNVKIADNGDFLHAPVNQLFENFDNVYKNDIKSFEKNNTQSNTSMAFYTKDYTR